jgi:hypothetical protein
MVSGSETSTVAFTGRLGDDDDDDDLGVDEDGAIWTGTACRKNLEYEPTCHRWVETGIKAKTETLFWIWNWPFKARNAHRILHPNSVKGPDLVLDVL